MTTLRLLSAVFILLVLGSTVEAQPQYNPHTKQCEDCIEYQCHTTVKCEPKKKECWEIECKQICIPAITWPWQSCCTPRCGRVINIKVPKTKEYECGVQKSYDREILPAPPCGCATCMPHAHHLPPQPLPIPAHPILEQPQ